MLCPDLKRSYGTHDYHNQIQTRSYTSDKLSDEYNDEANVPRRYRELERSAARKPLVERESDLIYTNENNKCAT